MTDIPTRKETPIMDDRANEFRHQFDAETIDRLTARPEPTKADWRHAAARIIASQPHRRANVDKLIEDAGVLARWLEYGWAEK